VLCLIAGFAVGLLLKQRNPWRLALNILLALAGSVVLHATFPMAKTTMPEIVNFWADPFLAEVDRLLHFGTDPWVVAHSLSQFFPMETVLSLYLVVWGPLAVGFPMLLAGFDQDAGRSRRFLGLYLFVWVGIGNFAALAGLSVGPVYYDRLLETGRFTDLTEILSQSPWADNVLYTIQENLWLLYDQGHQAFGAGISAFPSVHVAMAVLVGLYAWERSRWLMIPAVLYVTGIFFISVYSGYHYALDGYISFLLIWGLWRWLKRRESVRNAA